MEWVETTGRTLEDAKREALDRLGVAEEDAEFELLSEAKAGLFGRVRAEARVRARVRPTTPRPKDDRRVRRRRSAGEEGNGAPSAATPAPPEPDAAPLEAPTAAAGPDTAAPVVAAQGNGRTGPAGVGGDEMVEVPLAHQAGVAKSFLDGLLACFETPAQVRVTELDADTVELALEGDDLALLIGPKGATVNALQDLTRTVVQRQTGARHGRLLVDVGGYRQKRKAALARFVRQVADEVLGTGQEQLLEPMAAPDRKVVHDTVNEIEGVVSRSEGEEPRRRVVIQPGS